MKEGKWYNSDISKAILVIITALAAGGGGAFIKDQAEDPVDSDLNSFINNDYKSYKEWVNTQFKERDLSIKENTEYRLKQQGRQEISQQVTSQQFVNEYHYGVIFKRNMVTNKLYFDGKDGERYAVHYDDISDKYYYIDSYGDSHWCE